MNENKVKAYTELMKSLTAFIIGTGAGIFTLMTKDTPDTSDSLLLIFVIIMFLVSLGLFLAVFWYVDRNS
ncbi:MAG: hypothetical protein ABJH04_07580 [Cyclobacteriaceae bacterium]